MSLGKVFKASGGGAGVQVISDINMRTWFKDLFNNVMMESMESGDDVRVVGGYDPMKQEYLLTVLSPETYGLITYPYIPDVKDYDPSVIVDDGDEPPRPNPSIDVTWANSSSPKFTAPPPAWNVGYTYEGYSSYSTALDPNNQVFYEADILEPRYIQVDLNNIEEFTEEYDALILTAALDDFSLSKEKNYRFVILDDFPAYLLLGFPIHHLYQHERRTFEVLRVLFLLSVHRFYHTNRRDRPRPIPVAVLPGMPW